MNRKLKRALRNPAWRMILIAGIVAGGVLYGVQRLQLRVSTKLKAGVEAKEKVFRNSLEAFVEQGRNGRFREAVSNMLSMDSSSFTDAQRRDWLREMGRIYAWQSMNDSTSPELHEKLALKFYWDSLEISTEPRDRNKVFLLLGDIYLHGATTVKGASKEAVAQRKDKYMTASRYLNRVDRNLLEPEVLWRVDLSRAQCNWYMGSQQKALDLANRVVDAADDQKVWSQAVVQAAEWMLEASQQESLQEILSKTKLTPVKPEQLKRKAEENFRLIILQTDALDDSHGRAQLGLLRILLLDADMRTAKGRAKMDEAYEVSNNIQNEVMREDVKIACLEALARAEVRNNRPAKVLAALRYGHKQFPDYLRPNPLTRQLYDALVNQAESGMSLDRSVTEQEQARVDAKWDEAFQIAESVVRTARDAELIERMLDDFHPEKHRFFDKLDWEANTKKPKKRYYSRTMALLQMVLDMDRKRYSALIEKAQFLKSSIPVAAMRYEEAEANIAFSLRITTDPDYKEWLLYLDLLGAERMDRSAIVRAMRGKRYVTEFPNGAHLGFAITSLMQAYYEMGLYEQAMKTAKLMFIKEIVKLGDRAQDTGSSDWLNTVLKIAQCYAKEGKHRKANVIYRSYIEDVLNHNLPDDVYVDWVSLASNVDQNLEALRRMDLVRARIKSEAARIEQDVTRSILWLKVARSLRKNKEKLPRHLRESVARYLRTSAVGLDADKIARLIYEEAIRLADRVEQEERLDDKDQPVLTAEMKAKLLRRLYESIMDFAFDFAGKSYVDLEKLVYQVDTRFKQSDWPEYWILRLLAKRFNKDELAESLRRYQDNLTKMTKDSDAYGHVKRQIGLLAALTEARTHKAKLQERGVLEK